MLLFGEYNVGFQEKRQFPAKIGENRRKLNLDHNANFCNGKKWQFRLKIQQLDIPKIEVI
jgi:hypothetical protein